jgi:hypothetical protein
MARGGARPGAGRKAGKSANTSTASARARARARGGSENQRPWPADKVERWAIDRLIPYAKNARTHTDAQVAAIAASIKEWGWTTPALVGEDGGLIAGHARILAARQLGIVEIPVMVAAGWTEAQKRAYVLADNQLAITPQKNQTEETGKYWCQTVRHGDFSLPRWIDAEGAQSWCIRPANQNSRQRHPCESPPSSGHRGCSSRRVPGRPRLRNTRGVFRRRRSRLRAVLRPAERS